MQEAQGTKIFLLDDDSTCVKIHTPDNKQSITRSRYDLGFSDKATVTWDTFSTILKDGFIYLGLIPKDKEKKLLGDDIKKYSKKHKQLQRISQKLRIFFNKEWPAISIPKDYNFFEPSTNNKDQGFFKPKFITEEEVQGIQLMRRFHYMGVSASKFFNATKDNDDKDNTD